MVLFLFLALLVFGGLCLVAAAIGANQPSESAPSDADWGSRSAKRDAALSNQSDDDWSYDYDYDYDYDE